MLVLLLKLLVLYCKVLVLHHRMLVLYPAVLEQYPKMLVLSNVLMCKTDVPLLHPKTCNVTSDDVWCAGMAAYEDLLYTAGVLYNLMVGYAFLQACALLLMLGSFIQRW